FAPWSAFACVVGTGTGVSCSEAALDACLPDGGSFDGTVNFNCGGAATIAVTSTKSISADTTIDGGGVITISGLGVSMVFSVPAAVTFTIQNLAIVNGGASLALVNSNSLVAPEFTLPAPPGAMFNAGTLTVTNSRFAGNTGGFAGAIFNLQPQR